MVDDNITDDELPAGFLVATPSDPAANSYCTLEEMSQLLNGVSAKLSDKWIDLPSADQARLLLEGTRLIDQYKIWGPPKVATQGLCFPRKIDKADVIDTRVQRALMEYVKYRVDGKMVPIKNLQKEGVVQSAVLSQSSSLQADMSELPAGSRRELNKIAQSVPFSAQKRSYNAGDSATQQDGSLFG